MIHPLKSALAVLAAVPILTLATAARADGPTYLGSIAVTSTPPGASVVLKGPLQANGITPLWAPRFPVGTYRVEVSRKGYYTRRSRLLLSNGDSLHVDARLAPKSRAMGFARSVLIPGWGQIFNERPKRGLFFLTSEAAAAGVATYYATQFNHAVTRYEETADSLNSATTLDAAALYTSKLAERDAAWRRDYDRAKTAAYVAAGIWAAAALDALLFGPVREELPNVRLSGTPASMEPAAGGTSGGARAPIDGPRLALTVRF